MFLYEKVVQIRADPDTEDSMLFRPFSFTRGPGGNYYVADWGNHRIAVFDAEGNYLRAIGREGEGPGELMNPRLVAIKDDVITIAGNWTSRFTLDGEFIDELRSPVPSVDRTRAGLLVSYSFPQGDDGTGTYMLGMAARVQTADGEETARLETDQVARSRIGPDGTRHDFHYSAWPSLHYFAHTDEVLMVPGTTPELRWFALDGTETRRARIEAAPSALTAADRVRVLDHYDALIQAALDAGGDDLAEQLRSRKRQVEFADPKAFWMMPFVQPDGWLWLRYPAPDIGIRVSGSPPVEQPQAFRIVDERGEYLGDTAWPREAIRFGAIIANGHLMSMIPDRETGEIVPTAYRIVPAVPGLIYPSGASAPDS